MKRLRIYTTLVLIALVWSCSTDKNTWTSRTFHTVTAHYNIYFNAEQSVLRGEERINESYEDDYSAILPIYPSSDPKTGNVAKGEMETAIEKCSKLIKLHSITRKPKVKNHSSKKYKKIAQKNEFNEWVDDSYLLMGQSYFYQHNFLMADKSFTHVIRSFSIEPIKYDAYVWLARSYVEQERYAQAKELFEKLDGDNDFPRSLGTELALVKSDYYLRKDQYKDAVPLLKLAIDGRSKRKEKARYKFILAQVLEKIGKKKQAASYYEQVARMNPPYQMAFNSRIRYAMLYFGEGNSESLKKKLRRMLKDFKNEEYHDQIYYALAKICIQTGEKENALDYYRLSVAASIQNTPQRILSCIELADIYFEDEIYRPAQNYYDSAFVIMEEIDPDYKRVKSLSVNLTDLVYHLDVVATEDSLQYLAQMNEEERNILLDEWIKIAEKEAERLAEESEEVDLGGDFVQPRSPQAISGGGSGWYFYNPTTVEIGKSEFQRLWGRRKLEDDWRRKNKTTMTFEEIAEVEESVEETADTLQEKKVVIPRSNDKTTRNYYLQDVPFTDSLVNLSNERIVESLYQAGKIYQMEFNDYPKAAETYQELDKRFSNYEYELPVWFGLYNIFYDQKNSTEASRYSDLIVDHYPESKFAKYLMNPNYFVELEKLKEEQNQLYSDMFTGYNNHDWTKVDGISSQLLDMNPDSVLIPQISFFRTIARGSNRNSDEYAGLLRAYIDSFPEAETIPLANDILVLVEEKALFDYQALVESGYLNDEIVNQELAEGYDDESGLYAGKFTRDADLMHYFVVAYPTNTEVDVNRLKFDIANYNIDHYTRLDFDIDTDNLSDKYKLVVVREMNNKENALIYFRSVIRKRDVFESLKGVEYVNFVASSENLRTMKADKDFREYLRFYVRNYSRYISSDFPKDEIASPEEQMAEAQRKKLMEDKGEFVLITPKKEVEKPKEPELYARDDIKEHFFVIAVKDEEFDLKPLENSINEFNKSKDVTAHLKVNQRKLLDYRTVVVSGLKNDIEGISYFRMAVKNRDLFKSVEEMDYRNFVITLNNIDSLRKQKDLNTYMDFFRKEFLAKKKPVPVVSKPKPVEPKKKETTPMVAAKVEPKITPKVVKPVATPKQKVVEPKKEVAVEKPQDKVAEMPEEKAAEVQKKAETPKVKPIEESKKAEIQEVKPIVPKKEQVAEKPVEKVDEVPAEKPVEEKVKPAPVVPQAPKINYDGPFDIDLYANHLYALVIHIEGVDASKITQEIKLMNQQSGVASAKVSVEPLDDFRSVVKVEGLGNAEKSLAYFRSLVRNRKIFEPLGDMQYRNFIISDKNYALFRKDKNIKAYMDFYKLVYLKK